MLSTGNAQVVLEDAGHFVQLEQPQEFNRLVVEFIAAAGERAL